jgi:hypothetical protein
MPVLLKESGLPGPRGNLELAQAVALEAKPGQIKAFLAISPEEAPENTAEVFVVFCGVLALGRLIAAGNRTKLTTLRDYASDSRWRIREAVAMALQVIGDADMRLLLREMRVWCKGNWYEKRAAAAGLCEPRLLKKHESAHAVLKLLDLITAAIAETRDRKAASFRTLRQGMGYCWSVAVVAYPVSGKSYLEKWMRSTDPDVRWILRENLKKNRLKKMDPDWVRSCLVRIGSA